MTRRRAARFGAIQALYQAELTGRQIEAVILEFEQHRLADLLEPLEGRGPKPEVDRQWFASLTRGAWRPAPEHDPLIAATHAQGWWGEGAGDLRRAGLLEAHRGAAGGYRLTGDPADVRLADVIRAAEGPLAAVRGMPPEDTVYPGPAAPLTDVWVAVRASLRDVLESTTVADVLAGRLPEHVRKLVARPDSRFRR